MQGNLQILAPRRAVVRGAAEALFDEIGVKVTRRKFPAPYAEEGSACGGVHNRQLDAHSHIRCLCDCYFWSLDTPPPVC